MRAKRVRLPKPQCWPVVHYSGARLLRMLDSRLSTSSSLIFLELLWFPSMACALLKTFTSSRWIGLTPWLLHSKETLVNQMNCLCSGFVQERRTQQFKENLRPMRFGQTLLVGAEPIPHAEA